MLKLAITGNWAELTVVPGIHPAANDMTLAPAGKTALNVHFTTEAVALELTEQVGATVLVPVIDGVDKVVK